MSRTRIKLCGMMRPQDAALAARLGADAIGLILHPPARRYVEPERARQIIAALPPFVMAVGVFVEAPADRVRDTAAQVGLSAVQLHGRETPQDVADLRPLRVIKAIAVERQSLPDVLQSWAEAIQRMKLDNLHGLLLETATAGAAGGTGIENDWQAIAEARAAGLLAGLPPIILAGGLRPDNVTRVIRALRPWAVDTSSGIEQRLGEKSNEKMQRFIGAVAEADAENSSPPA